MEVTEPCSRIRLALFLRNLTALLAFVAWLPAMAVDPYASTYQKPPAEPFIIRHANIYDGTGQHLTDSDVYVEDGRIRAVGQNLANPSGASEVDARNRWLTPGIIDVHSHAGVYPQPDADAHNDGNEASAPVTAEVWAEHSVWPQDPGFFTALAGGVTTLQILPGSANLIGGRSVTMKNVPALTMQGKKFPGAPYGLKMACGENPKRVYGKERKKAPQTRMGNVAGYRKAWIAAQQYRDEWAAWEQKAETDKEAKQPKRDLAMETLVGVLEGQILVHNHCYRADEMAVMLDLADEFGYHVTAFHHAVEAYKIGQLLASKETCAAIWADWWGFKIEAYDGINENAALLEQAGACVIIHSDSSEGIQRLNQEAAKASAAGSRVGLSFPPGQVMRWLTINPAKALGIDQETGSIEVDKAADLVLWNREPFSVYALAEQVYIDGILYYDRNSAKLQPSSDFEIGQPAAEVLP